MHPNATGFFQGGSGDDIIVYIFDITNFDNYETGAYFGALYQSSQTTTSSILSPTLTQVELVTILCLTIHSQRLIKQ